MVYVADDATATPPVRTFQYVQTIFADYIFYVDNNLDLWSHLQRSLDGPVVDQKIQPLVRTFDASLIDSNDPHFAGVMILWYNGALWFMRDILSTHGQGTSTLIGEDVVAFEYTNTGYVVQKADGTLWIWTHSTDSLPDTPPTVYIEVDGNVQAFQWSFENSLEGLVWVYVLGTDGNLWLEQPLPRSTPSVPPPRQHVDGNVSAFQQLDIDTVLVLGTDGNLWLEHGPFGQVPVPPPREQVDGNVRNFQGIDRQTVFVLGTDGNLWLEHGPFGQVPVPPPREHVSGSVQDFQAYQSEQLALQGLLCVLVLGTDGTLWFYCGPFGDTGPLPEKIAGDVIWSGSANFP
jgi:hypothetical protein